MTVLHRVDARRLGYSYGLHVTKKKVSIIADCLQATTEGEPEAIFEHARINDVKSRGAEETGK